MDIQWKVEGLDGYQMVIGWTQNFENATEKIESRMDIRWISNGYPMDMKRISNRHQLDDDLMSCFN